ncbi:MAG TPA: TolC family protein [Puia sp.]|jgi:outer membrane protein TolC|nr:TolC family protein [Puia sp.]
MKKIFYVVFVSSGFSFLSFIAGAQTIPPPTNPGSTTAADTGLPNATLQACVQYALKHYPLVQQAYLDEQITDRQIKSKLADWYPQLNLNANYQNNFQLQSIAFNGSYTKSGTYNTSTVGLALSQTIFNRDVLLASRTKKDVITQSRQTTVSDKIDVAVNVSKAFYDVLLTQQQIDVLSDDIVRLERNLKDATNQYRGGLVDKTDYKRATISLNNSKAEKRTNEEALKAKYAVLKQLMGYTGKDSIQLVYDSTQMASEVNVDTTAAIDYSKRIEYQLLLTQKRLQQADLQYNKWSYLPTLTAGAGYNLNYLNSRFGNLYTDNFPNSYAGLQLSFPIFQGTKRTQNIRIAELQLTRIDWDMVNLQTTISSQYAQALAAYKGYLNDYYVLKDNLDLAREVFNTIELQYRSGIKAYLDLITAETDLRTAQSNFSNALYQVLSSKLDVQKALGTIQFN